MAFDISFIAAYNHLNINMRRRWLLCHEAIRVFLLQLNLLPAKQDGLIQHFVSRCKLLCMRNPSKRNGGSKVCALQVSDLSAMLINKLRMAVGSGLEQRQNWGMAYSLSMLNWFMYIAGHLNKRKGQSLKEWSWIIFAEILPVRTQIILNWFLRELMSNVVILGVSKYGRPIAQRDISLMMRIHL